MRSGCCHAPADVGATASPRCVPRRVRRVSVMKRCFIKMKGREGKITSVQGLMLSFEGVRNQGER